MSRSWDISKGSHSSRFNPSANDLSMTVTINNDMPNVARYNPQWNSNGQYSSVYDRNQAWWNPLNQGNYNQQKGSNPYDIHHLDNYGQQQIGDYSREWNHTTPPYHSLQRSSGSVLEYDDYSRNGYWEYEQKTQYGESPFGEEYRQNMGYDYRSYSASEGYRQASVPPYELSRF